MASLGQTFDANSVSPAAAYTPIPAGKYAVQIVDSEMKGTSTGGKMLVLQLEIADGEFTGRRLWDRLNLVNSNATAQEIAQRTLSAICHATGQMTVQDSEQLHFKPMIVTVKVRPAGPDRNGVERDAQNEIKGYEAAGASRPPVSPGVRGVAPAQQQAKAGPPWRRNAAA
jgi:hypothetical protein